MEIFRRRKNSFAVEKIIVIWYNPFDQRQDLLGTGYAEIAMEQLFSFTIKMFFDTPEYPNSYGK
jgi:hypothetical protein